VNAAKHWLANRFNGFFLVTRETVETVARSFERYIITQLKQGVNERFSFAANQSN